MSKVKIKCPLMHKTCRVSNKRRLEISFSMILCSIYKNTRELERIFKARSVYESVMSLYISVIGMEEEDGYKDLVLHMYHKLLYG